MTAGIDGLNLSLLCCGYTLLKPVIIENNCDGSILVYIYVTDLSYILDLYRATRRPKPATGERLKCSDCPKTYKYQHLLNYHKRHECGKEIKCEKCSKTFTSFVQLSEHKKYGCDSMFQCVTCEKILYNVAAIRAHTSTNYACALPGIRWTQIK